MKILAVDDDPFILELLTIMAARAGFTDVTTALSGEIALAMVNENSTVFDCLLVDISMPGMDGIELCGIVRKIPGYEITPIIILTAMAEKDYIDRAFQAGATDYANKPFNIVELHARLRMTDELITTRQQTDADDTTSDDTIQSKKHHFDLSKKVAIGGVKNLITYSALKNYLVQLSHAGVASSQVVAVKVDRIKYIYQRASKAEFLYALTEAADAIDTAHRTIGHLMAYAGDGTFVVVSSKASLELSVALETEIQNLLDGRETEYDNGDPLDIEVSVGNPIRPVLNKMQQQTIDRAIARVDSRIVEKGTAKKPPNIRLIGT